MQQVVLSPTGREAVDFNGKLLIQLEGHDTDGQTGGRWHDIAIYRLDDDSLTVAVAYRTSASGESGNFFVDTAQDAAEVDAILSLYDPIEFLVMDSTPQRNRFVDALLRHYDLQVNEALKQLQASSDATGLAQKPR